MNRVRQAPHSYIPIALAVTGAVLGTIGLGIGYYAADALPRYPAELYLSEYEEAVLTSLIGIQKVGIALAIGLHLVAACFCLVVSAVLAAFRGAFGGGRPNGCKLQVPCPGCVCGL